MSARAEDINGYVTILRNPISRAGVFQYMGSSIGGDAEPGKIYNVYRPAESLQDPESLDTFRLIPIIDDHDMLGPEEMGLLPPEAKGVAGTTGEQLEYDPVSNILFANLRIYSQKLLEKIKSGKIDLSMGYRCAYKKIAGFFNGMPYDYIQVGMKGNHLALVDEARCNVSVLDHKFTYDARDIIEISPSGDIVMTEEEKKAADKAAKDAAEKEAADAAMAEKEAADKKAKDETEAKEKKDAEDKAAADKKAKDDMMSEGDKKGMDAAAVERIAQDAAAKAVAGMPTFADFAKEAKARDDLHAKLVPVIGAFDCKEKTLAQTAAYGAEKLGLKVAAGQEIVALDGFFAGRAKSSEVGFALDGRPASTKNKVTDKIGAHINGAKSA